MMNRRPAARRPTRPLRRILERAAHLADVWRGWYRYGLVLGLTILIGLRDTLREHNLVATDPDPSTLPNLPPCADEDLPAYRTIDGSYNTPGRPTAGMAGMPFGRNVALEVAQPERATLMTPNPRIVSEELMTRHKFQPAETLNLLAATWVQFMVKDWFSHGRGVMEGAHEISVPAADPWRGPRPIKVPRIVPNDPRADKLITFKNETTAWWDASVIYGASQQEQAFLRSHEGGRLRVDDKGLPGFSGTSSPVNEPGFWAGLGSMGALFCLEHNAVAGAIAAANPRWTDEAVFQHSRLVISALIAKIHTVEWTPAILARKVTEKALDINWYGIAGKRLRNSVGRISRNEVVSGILGGRIDDFGVNFSLTEEFSMVYRMHPLIPDVYTIRHWDDSQPAQPSELRLDEITGSQGWTFLQGVDMADLLYSFGTSHPGRITLNNFPQALQEFHRPDGLVTDLAATDILRTRELGVPRYNEFRRQLHLRPAKDFADLTTDPDLENRLRRIYDDDIEMVDTIVGMFAETPPEGFGFSDTAFRIFVLMASRRLNSDRFFTRDFTPEVYSKIGYRWVMENGFTDVLLRHYPELTGALAGAKNPFAPWPNGK